MRKVILTTTEDPYYKFFEPITRFCWEQMGYDVICRTYDDVTKSQVARLHAYKYCEPDDYLVMGDIDMLPLNRDYFNFIEDRITIAGWDITGYTQIPMCYVGMKARKWAEVMRGHTLETDLELLKSRGEVDPMERWCFDQELLTSRLLTYKAQAIRLDRGKAKNGLVSGRVDRHKWELIPVEQMIDAHLLRPGYTPENWKQIRELLKVKFGANFDEYRDEFLTDNFLQTA